MVVVVSLSGDGIGIDGGVWMTPAVVVEERAFLFRLRLMYVGMDILFNGLFTTDVWFHFTLATKGKHSLPCRRPSILNMSVAFQISRTAQVTASTFG